MSSSRFVFALTALSVACSDPTPAAPTDASVPSDAADARVGDGGITSVPESESWIIPGMQREAHVLRTAGNVPHIYAANPEDLARVTGFVVARDRYFMLDLARRLAQGKLSALLGDAALETDLQSRQTGMTYVTEQLDMQLSETEGRRFDAFAQGINAYIEQVRGGLLAPPSEYTIAVTFLGRRRPIELMEPFNRRDIVAMGATFLYQSGYETDDVGRGRAAAALPGDYTGQALAELRRAGATADIFNRITQVRAFHSANGWGLESGGMMVNGLDRIPTPPLRPDRAPPVQPGRSRTPPVEPGVDTGRRTPREMLARLEARLEQIQHRLQREEGFGSNAWAVMGRHTRDGATLLAGDGHLPLTIPSLFYQIGFDTVLLGGGNVRQVGIALPLLPYLAMGTNGRVAWSFTQLAGDITDWYREEITLDASGAPQSSRFQGAVRPLVRVDERVTVADVPMLMSRGRTEAVARWTTFDGRWITQIEGRRVTATETLRPGETRVYLLGDWIAPGDTDGDGVVTAMSFDYTALDRSNVFDAFTRFGLANNVMEYRAATRGLVALSLNQLAADSAGSVYYSGYQAVPCRGYLPRDTNRNWMQGADPSRILDGTRYGGFHIPVRDLLVDEAPGMTDPYQCVVPFARTPAVIDPTDGFVVTANNEPGDITGDDSVTNDPYYIGGPWNDGYRAARIADLLREGVMARNHDEDRMAAIQADVRSPLGVQFGPVLLDAIEQARTAAMGTPMAGTPEARLAMRYMAARTDYEEVARRVRAWIDGGAMALSGVETFYHTPAQGERDAAVATSVFNAWMGRFVRGVFDDERFPDGIWSNGGSAARIRTLAFMVQSRGENTARLASWNSATGESAYFDVLGTSDVETSREVALTALDQALMFLRSAPSNTGGGGFGTNTMDGWLWGLRHTMRFDSILNSFLGDNMSLAPLADGFSITPMRLPLVMGMTLPSSDPRASLRGFPRPGDQWVVDAANSGLSGENFTFGSGPTYRMVVALRREGQGSTTGRNVIPGGQSGLTNSMNFQDQAALWLGNRTLPMYLTPEEVTANATSRERFPVP